MGDTTGTACQCQGCTYLRNNRCYLGLRSRYTCGCWHPAKRLVVAQPPPGEWKESDGVEVTDDDI